MIGVMIHSLKSMPNKEKYISSEISKYRNQRLVSVEKLETGGLEITFGKDITGIKYFVKVFNKKKYRSSKYFIELYNKQLSATNCERTPKVIAELDYATFTVLFFETHKRKSKNKRKK